MFFCQLKEYYIIFILYHITNLENFMNNGGGSLTQADINVNINIQAQKYQVRISKI